MRSLNLLVAGAALVALAIAGLRQLFAQGPESFSWYAARSAGLVSYVLLSLTVLLGLAASMRVPSPGSGRAGTTIIHRGVSTLALVFLGLHIAALLADKYVPFNVATVLGLELSDYRPLAVLAGSAAMWLTILSVIAFAWRRALGPTRWRWLHRSGYVAWALAVTHGITAGVDTGADIVLAIYALSVAAVAGLFVFRLLRQQRPQRTTTRAHRAREHPRHHGTPRTVDPGFPGTPWSTPRLIGRRQGASPG